MPPSSLNPISAMPIPLGCAVTMDSIGCNSSAGVMRDMRWRIEGSFVAIEGLSATENDSIHAHYVAQCVTLTSDRVVQSACASAAHPSFTAIIAVNRRRIHRKRSNQNPTCIPVVITQSAEKCLSVQLGTASFSSKLFQLRLKSREKIGPVFFCTVVDRKIVMLHQFVKKTDKTPPKELALARKRMRS
jgi:hypothetical protein